MKSLTLAVGPIGTNCYLVYLEKARRLFIIDPGADAPAIIDGAARFPGAERTDILLTHAHVDHISAAGEVSRRLGIARVMLDPADMEIYRSPYNELLPFMPAPEGLPETQDFVTDGLFSVLRVPGHSPGGCAFYFDCEGSNALFCGDTLFAGSVGRSDLPGGDHETLIASIKTRLLTLPPLTPVFPGHGGATTIGRELAGNPYLT